MQVVTDPAMIMQVITDPAVIMQVITAAEGVSTAGAIEAPPW